MDLKRKKKNLIFFFEKMKIQIMKNKQKKNKRILKNIKIKSQQSSNYGKVIGQQGTICETISDYGNGCHVCNFNKNRYICRLF